MRQLKQPRQRSPWDKVEVTSSDGLVVPPKIGLSYSTSTVYCSFYSIETQIGRLAICSNCLSVRNLNHVPSHSIIDAVPHTFCV